jgi:hypothetical protein
MKQQSITSLPLSPEAERRNRMIKYSVTMGIRVVCIVLMLFVQGWWLLVCAIGAITLPYFAVVIANVHADPRGARVFRPGAIEVSRGPAGGWDNAGNAGNNDVHNASYGANGPGDSRGANHSNHASDAHYGSDTDGRDGTRDADGSAA